MHFVGRKFKFNFNNYFFQTKTKETVFAKKKQHVSLI